jgi:ANTAR domain
MAVAARGYVRRMELIPETLEALDELDPFQDDTPLAEQLTDTSHRAQAVAPGLVGVSLASRQHDLTFTIVATDLEIATLDAVQYVDSGPCVDAIDLGAGVASSPEGLLSESRWRTFARASAAAGVHSTLTLPVVSSGVVVATVNLYGHAADTFVGRHAALAEVFGAWAPGAIVNADLGFSTRTRAQQAPARLRDTALIDTATGILAAHRGTTVAEARRELDDAARRAGVPVVALARVLVSLRSDS